MANGRVAVRRSVKLTVPWGNIETREADDGVSYILGFSTGHWRMTKRDAEGHPVEFDCGATEKSVCRGVAGVCEFDIDGDFVAITVPVCEDEQGDPSFRELWSDDGGETWEREIS